MPTVTEDFQLTDELREWFVGNGFQINLIARTQAFIQHYEKKDFRLTRAESWVPLWKRWIEADAKNPKFIIQPKPPKVIRPGSLDDVDYGQPIAMPEELRRLIRRGRNVPHNSPSSLSNEVGESEVCLPSSEGAAV